MALSISPCYEFEFGTTVLSPNVMKTNVEFEVWTKTSGLKFEFIARTNAQRHWEPIWSFGIDYWEIEIR